MDCLRRALSNLRDLLNAVNDSYSSSLQCVCCFVSYNFLCADLCLRNDDYVREDDYDVKAAVDETLRERGFAVEEDDRMDVS